MSLISSEFYQTWVVYICHPNLQFFFHLCVYWLSTRITCPKMSHTGVGCSHAKTTRNIQHRGITTCSKNGWCFEPQVVEKPISWRRTQGRTAPSKPRDSLKSWSGTLGGWFVRCSMWHFPSIFHTFRVHARQRAESCFGRWSNSRGSYPCWWLST